jgi:hypothetical protein
LFYFSAWMQIKSHSLIIFWWKRLGVPLETVPDEALLIREAFGIADGSYFLNKENDVSLK